MKVKKKPMPMLQKCFYILSFLFLIGAFIYLGTKDFNVPKKKISDSETFTIEYGITSDNIFFYKSAKDILEIIKNKSGVIYMAYPENKWSAKYAEILNEAAKKSGIKEIYYYNFKLDRSNNNHYYESIVEILHPYIPNFDYQNENIYAPTLIIVKEGKIIYYDDETSITRGDNTVDTYWTKSKKEQKVKELVAEFKLYLEGINE